MRGAYGDLVAGDVLRAWRPTPSELRPGAHHHRRHRACRVDIPAKVTGGASQVQDMRPARHSARARGAAAELLARSPGSQMSTPRAVRRCPASRSMRDGTYPRRHRRAARIPCHPGDRGATPESAGWRREAKRPATGSRRLLLRLG